MKAILRTNDYTKPFEIVEVIKNPISEKNGLAHIKNVANQELMTGGILVDFNPITCEVLNKLSYKEQYEWLKTIYVPQCKYVV